MATVTYYIRGKKNPSPIYIRFSVNREIFLRKSTGIEVNPSHFKNGKIRRLAVFKERDAIEQKLADLRAFLIASYNKASKNRSELNTEWLQNQIDLFNGKVVDIDLSYLDNYAKKFIDNLPNRRSDKGSRGVSISTLKKYTTIFNKILSFQEYRKKRILLTEVNEELRDELLNYFEDVENLSTNTAGRYLKFVKTICLDAKKRGVMVSKELGLFMGFSEKVDKIHLSFDELEILEKEEFERKELEHARDWLIIGCYIGQRIGDTLRLTKNNIHEIGELEFIELVQEKTSKKVMVLIHPKVREILDQRGGRFPMSFANTPGSRVTMFNRYIKEVCKIAKIDKPTKGARINPDTNRKEKGTFPKWELVTSHICRRSFATNYYGHVPTPFLMEITGHSREEEFLNYISKPPIDYAEQMLKYWKVAIEDQEKKSHLKAV